MATHLSADARARIAAAWPDILARIAAGELIKDIRASHGISEQQLRAFRVESAALQAQWDAAKEDSAGAFMDEALGVARDRTITGEHAAHARTRIDTLKWAARIRNPRAYSDKAQLDVNVKTLDLTRIIQDANARLAAGRAPRVIEHAAGAAIEHQASKLLELL